MLTRLVFVLSLVSFSSAAQTSILTKTSAWTAYRGYFNFWWDAQAGKVWLEIDKLGKEFLYVNSLAYGVGSNDIGLDRGQLGQSRVVKFERNGPKILLVQPNLGFRATSTDRFERAAVEQSFAESVLWGFTVEAEENGKVLVDATAFLLRDAHNVAGALQQSKQGTFRVDSTRSAIFLPRSKNFPKNTELEATITLTGEGAGQFVRQVTPSSDAITVHQHHSLIELPDTDYEPRVFDPRAGYFGISYYDFATPIDQSLTKRFITRHRLKKKNPSAAMSEAVKPIVYYLDRGAPEPVRSALLDGARWWNQAFEAAGFKDAFRVELLPEDADSLDVRYNVIQWVHRATRGWSYGSSVRDPRTGEIIKGHVTLDSLRVRQDFLIGEGLLAPYEAGKPIDPQVMALCLARLRQLSAHEVGHTLGLAHSYAASSYNRGSVMDYPHPLIALPEGNGAPSVADAYTKEIGEWDKVAIAWGYLEAAPAAREKILSDAYRRGVYFLTDIDARPEGSAHPSTHLWDNGPDAVAELKRVSQLRKRVLDRFGEKNIPVGEPFALLEDRLVPTYMLHRYQTEAATKLIGGLDYRYALRGDGQSIAELIPPEKQRAALDGVLATLAPDFLTLPDRVLKLIPPRPAGYGSTRELFAGRTGLTFDPLAAAEASANLTVGLLLNEERAERLYEHHVRDPKQPSLEEVLEKLKVIQMNRKQGVPEVTANVIVDHMMQLAANPSASAHVRQIAMRWLESVSTTNKSWKLKRFLENPETFKAPQQIAPPPGQPIGELLCSYDQ